MLTLVCLRWGRAFQADHVNVLFRAARRSLDEPFRFACLTEEGVEGKFDDGIEALPIPDMKLPPERWKWGCWPKLGMFAPGLFDEADLVLYLDLDLVILGSLTPFVERARAIPGFHILREWNPIAWDLAPVAWRPDRGAQGSIIAWRPQEQAHIFPRFMADPDDAYRSGTDQRYLTRVAANWHYWPVAWTVSFRRTCVWRYPLNLVFRTVRQPKRAHVVVFHGHPKPWDLLGGPGQRWGTPHKFGYGSVGWVVRYWNQGRGASVPDTDLRGDLTVD